MFLPTSKGVSRKYSKSQEKLMKKLDSLFPKIHMQRIFLLHLRDLKIFYVFFFKYIYIYIFKTVEKLKDSTALS